MHRPRPGDPFWSRLPGGSAGPLPYYYYYNSYYYYYYY